MFRTTTPADTLLDADDESDKEGDGQTDSDDEEEPVMVR